MVIRTYDSDDQSDSEERTFTYWGNEVRGKKSLSWKFMHVVNDWWMCDADAEWLDLLMFMFFTLTPPLGRSRNKKKRTTRNLTE